MYWRPHFLCIFPFSSSSDFAFFSNKNTLLPSFNVSFRWENEYVNYYIFCVQFSSFFFWEVSGAFKNAWLHHLYVWKKSKCRISFHRTFHFRRDMAQFRFEIEKTEKISAFQWSIRLNWKCTLNTLKNTKEW